MIPYHVAVKDILTYLANAPRAKGLFTHLSSLCPKDFTHGVRRTTTFFTANILECLNTIGAHPRFRVEAAPIRARAAASLNNERSPRWSFNYWAKGSDEAELIPYPDDLDDTFNALTALADQDPGILDGDLLASVAGALVQAETQPGGPYRTWLTDARSGPWADVDIAVNSTIGYFLARHTGVRLPLLEKFIEDAVDQRTIRSPYYPGEIHVLYFIARYYGVLENKDAAREKIAALVQAALVRDGDTGAGILTPLERAMAISSLVRCGAHNRIKEKDVHILASHAPPHGTVWQPHPFCIDPSRGGRLCYAGSGALTAAFVGEALALHEMRGKARHHGSGHAWAPVRHQRIIALAQKELERAAVPPLLLETAGKKVNAVTDQRITTLAYSFRDAMGVRGNAVSNEIVEQLALANLYGWIAHTIHDDILDLDAPTNIPSMLPVANLFLRELSRIYERLASTAVGIDGLFHGTMHAMDEANFWEQHHCRFPVISQGHFMEAFYPENLPDFGDYRHLADRSAGHAMGPLAALMIAGWSRDSAAFHATEDFFRHYLIARQLHDDAHDWADDLRRERLTSVNVPLLCAFRQAHGGFMQPASIEDAVPGLREHFWHHTIDGVVRTIRRHIAAAREARYASEVIADKTFMEDALSALERGARAALAERDKVLCFARHYPQKGPL